jgi:2Fe-2S ferredoxin
MNVYDVTFLFEDKKIPQPIHVKAAEGESILDIALENGIELHHNCGGVCACSTCHVYIEEGMENLPEMTDKEEDFVDRAINPKLESRLGCQCLIYGNVTVRVPDQSVLLGH